jgi:hypothetical protein
MVCVPWRGVAVGDCLDTECTSRQIRRESVGDAESQCGDRGWNVAFGSERRRRGSVAVGKGKRLDQPCGASDRGENRDRLATRMP